MSLKAFHVIFVIASILLGLGVGGWGIHQFRTNDDVGLLALGIIFLAMGILLMIYGKRMLKKTKNIGYLTLLGMLFTAPKAHACATCYGESDAPMAEGMNAAIFTLLIVITTMLGGILAFFIFIMRRSARMAAHEKLIKDPSLLGVKELDLSEPSTVDREFLNS
tara:strand:+ start:1582 stop:2073 length:492 start_codon:yes stop_codon:yes gene_type:complete